MRIQDLKVWEQLQKKLTWEQLGEFSGKRILEFGCGNGVMGAGTADGKGSWDADVLGSAAKSGDSERSGLAAGNDEARTACIRQGGISGYRVFSPCVSAKAGMKHRQG